MSVQVVEHLDGSLDVLFLQEISCELCTLPLMGMFRDGELVATEPCHDCLHGPPLAEGKK